MASRFVKRAAAQQSAYLRARFKRLPALWKAVVVAVLAIFAFFAGKFILALVVGLIMTAFAIVAILLIPVMLIAGLAGGGKKRGRHSDDGWYEENDGRGRYHSDSGVPF
ncbi:hypothetical protein ACH4U6_16595 [Streptomyces netropsis]|uniref:hypothetical protein n=1 Tax=Streptomyces netropsis TaxID=55404 RepID=UPI0037B1A84D